MSTTYRWTVNPDVYKTRNQIQPHGSLVFKRDSKKAAQEAMTAFYQTIRQHMPDGENARAWLEVSDRYGPRTLVSLKRVVEPLSTPTRPNVKQFIHAWQDAHGAIVASFLYEIELPSGLRSMQTGKLL